MRVGATISGLAHLGLVAFALAGLRSDDDRPLQSNLRVTDVSVISLDAYNAAQSTAPEPGDAVATLGALAAEIEPAERPAQDTQPTVPDAEFPEAPATEEAPDLSSFALAEPEVMTETAEPDPQAAAPQTPFLAGPSFDGSFNSTETALLPPSAPSLSPRIDTSAAPKPPERVEQAETPVEEVAALPQQDATERPEPKEEAAPEEAATDVAPDASETEEVFTPTAALRPPARPAPPTTNPDIAARKERQKNQPAAPDAQPSDGAPESQPQAARLGTDFNSGEKQAIGDAIDPFWNKAPLLGKAGYEDLVVTVRVKLNGDGTVAGDVQAIDPANPTGDFAIAFRQARIAVMRAATAGLPLPKGKFRAGDFLEIRFDPGRDAVSFQ